MTNTIPAALARCRPDARARLVASLPERAVRALNAEWAEWALPGQIEPPAFAGAGAGAWRTWVLMAGRGWGKTRAGAEWVMGRVRAGVSTLRQGSGQASLDMGGQGRRAHPRPLPEIREGRKGRGIRIALVAASLDEGRRVMVEGPSGLLAVARPGEVRDWSFARRTLTFANGAEATLFSGAHPEGLRGPEHDFAWCDELGKWRHPQEAWDNLQLGLRRGAAPRALVTTTPKRVAALRGIVGAAGTVMGGGASAANPYLPEGWVAAQAARLGPGLLGRQELGGELLDEVAGALWSRGLIERCRVGAGPFAGVRVEGPLHQPAAGHPPRAGEDLVRVVVGVDPPAGVNGAACGIVACGLGADGLGYVLGDHTAAGLSPEGWARKVEAAVAAHGAVQVIAESNQGGDMVRSVLRAAGVAVPVRLVHASRSKAERAAPVAALFEAGKVRIAGDFPALEDELAGMSWDGCEGASDRVDAMVWALTELMLRPGGAPSVRTL